MGSELRQKQICNNRKRKGKSRNGKDLRTGPDKNGKRKNRPNPNGEIPRGFDPPIRVPKKHTRDNKREIKKTKNYMRRNNKDIRQPMDGEFKKLRNILQTVRGKSNPSTFKQLRIVDRHTKQTHKRPARFP